MRYSRSNGLSNSRHSVFDLIFDRGPKMFVSALMLHTFVVGGLLFAFAWIGFS